MNGIYGILNGPIKVQGDATLDHYLYYDGETVWVYSTFHRSFDENRTWPAAYSDFFVDRVKQGVYSKIVNERIIQEVMSAF